MGITGGYAGQLFGLLVGFGLAMLKTSLTTGTVEDPVNAPNTKSKYVNFPLF